VTHSSIFIYCDDPSHSRRQAVTNFKAEPDGRWNEHYASTAAQGRRESGQTIGANDSPLEARELSRRGLREVIEAEGPFRSRYRLECRRCKRRPVIAREEPLFAVLTRLTDTGLFEVSLILLAATLQRQSEATRADPEPGLG